MKDNFITKLNNNKMIWWNYFLANQEYWTYGLTYSKLKKMKDLIFFYKPLWEDLFQRHNTYQVFPWNMKEWDKENFEHAIGNFSGIITELAYRHDFLKKTG